MNDAEFRHEHGARLEAARAARGPCPDADQLLDFVAGGLPVDPSRAVEAHLPLCPDCEALVERLREAPEPPDEVTLRRIERRLDRRAAPWREAPRRAWLAPLAAALALAAVAVVWRTAPPPPPAAPVERGAGVALARPLGTVTKLDLFVWESSPVWIRYRLEVERDGQLWSSGTDAPRLAPPPDLAELLAKAESFRWRVLALADDGSVLAESSWVEVSVSAPANP